MTEIMLPVIVYCHYFANFFLLVRWCVAAKFPSQLQLPTTTADFQRCRLAPESTRFF